MQQVTLYVESEEFGTYSNTTHANVAARQIVKAVGMPVMVRVYEVTGTSKMLVRKYRVIKKLDDSVVFA